MFGASQKIKNTSCEVNNAPSDSNSVHAQPTLERNCLRTECEEAGAEIKMAMPELFQRKYKCFIIYIISLISLIELILIVFNSEGGSGHSSSKILDVLSRFVNRTHTVL